MAVRTENRTVGAKVANAITVKHPRGLPENTLSIRLTGSAGQSFGAFIVDGMRLDLEGEANDYVGKGLSGGRLIVRHPRAAQFIPDQTVLIGNTVLYGATSGEAYFAGTAGERFAVRNSGAIAVVEGVGDHGCEYMTGGTVVVLGKTGRNFAAGMSGGLAFVLDEFDLLKQQCNMSMVDLIPVADLGERETLRHLVEQHARYTGSARAKRLLNQWDKATRHFFAVMPREYRAALERQREAEASSRVVGARGGLAIVDARIDRHG
jgi:glutamate synthase domain-containing protein 3